jgi:hypothetical protein
MPATKIMLIRHAERPSDDGKVKGVTADGEQDPKELVVRGWQRSGALVRLFAPRNGKFVDSRLAQPKTIFAAAAGDEDGKSDKPGKSDKQGKDDEPSKSLRPQHTVLALADALNLSLDLRFPKGKEPDLAEAAVKADGPVLIAWQHEAIPDIVNMIVGNKTTCPQKWHGSRYDLVWVLDRRTSGPGWDFAQVPQVLLAGDSEKEIAFSSE